MSYDNPMEFAHRAQKAQQAVNDLGAGPPPSNDEKILKLIQDYGWIDGGHHKQWVLTEIAKVVLGDKYEEWAAADEQTDAPAWDEGIAP